MTASLGPFSVLMSVFNGKGERSEGSVWLGMSSQRKGCVCVIAHGAATAALYRCGQNE